MTGSFSFKAYRRRFTAPLRTAGRVWAQREGFIVRHESSAGIGYGEVAPIPEFGTETLAAAESFLKGWRADPTREIPADLPCCAFAIGSAQRVCTEPRRPYPIAALLPAGVAAKRHLIEKAARGYRTFKWKVGVESPAVEQAILRELLERTASTVQFRLDANGAWSPQDLAEWLDFLHPYRLRIAFIEQPLAVGQELVMATFAAESGIPIALDESLNGVAGDRWLRDWEGPLVVKAALMGDPNRLIARLRPRASQVVLSSVFETGVGLANTLQVADALPEINQPIGFDTSNFGDMLNLSLTQPVLSLEEQARIPTKELWKQLPDCD